MRKLVLIIVIVLSSQNPLLANATVNDKNVIQSIKVNESSSEVIDKPNIISKGMFKSVIKANRDKYISKNINYREVTAYSATGYYFSEPCSKYLAEEPFERDKNNLPLILNAEDNKYYYNPVTVSHYALRLYNIYLFGNKDSATEFLYVADWLVDNSNLDGGLRYEFPYNGYSPGWTSAMAQGQVLSVLTRAYSIRHKEKYLIACNKIFKFLVNPKNNLITNISSIDEKFKDNLFLQEYPLQENSIHKFTLNGYMFSMIGIYDWSTICPNDEPKIYLEKFVDTLKILLPYYDIGGFSSYDLDYLFNNNYPYVSAAYHGIHLQLLSILNVITKDPVFDYYKTLWKRYVETKPIKEK